MKPHRSASPADGNPRGQGLAQILKHDLMAIAEELKLTSVDLYAAEIKAGRIARAIPERLRCCAMM